MILSPFQESWNELLAALPEHLCKYILLQGEYTMSIQKNLKMLECTCKKTATVKIFWLYLKVFLSFIILDFLKIRLENIGYTNFIFEIPNLHRKFINNFSLSNSEILDKQISEKFWSLNWEQLLGNPCFKGQQNVNYYKNSRWQNLDFFKIVKMYVGKLRYGLKFGNHQNLSSLWKLKILLFTSKIKCKDKTKIISNVFSFHRLFKPFAKWKRENLYKSYSPLALIW